MLFKTFKGYMEGMDISAIPMGYFGLPSKNFLIRKGVAYTRPGIVNDGTKPTGNYPIRGSHSFKDAPSGEQGVRITSDGRVQLKYLGNWITITSTLTAPNAARIRFTEWLDTLGSIIKKRLFFVDGTLNIYQWNGAMGIIRFIQSVTGNIVAIISNPMLATGSSVDNMSGGAGYVPGDMLAVSGGNGDAVIEVIVTEGTGSSGGIGAFTLTNPGSGYSGGSIVTVQTPAGGQAAIITVLTIGVGGAIATYSITHSGYAYVPGTTYTTTGGTSGTTATITPTTVGAVITDWEVVNPGSGYSGGSNIACAGGTGIGATIQITNTADGYVVIEDPNDSGIGNIAFVGIQAGGTGYAVNDHLTIASPTGGESATVFVAAVNGSGVIESVGLSTEGQGFAYGDVIAATGGSGTGASIKVLGVGKTALQLGFDPPGNASGVVDTVSVVRFTSPGVVAGIDSYNIAGGGTNRSTPANILPFGSSMSNVPNVGDIVIGQFTSTAGATFLPQLPTYDEIYTYQNHVVVASLASTIVYFSDSIAYLAFSVPDEDLLASSAFIIQLPGYFTAMRNRLNPQTQLGVCWISTRDSWTKVTQAFAADAEGNYVTAVQITETDSLGALPFMVADYEGDPIYLGYDFRLQRIESVEAVGKDAFKTLSDEVSDMLARLDWTEGRMIYTTRYVYLLSPANSTMVLLDMIEGAFQPPQDMPAADILNIGGILYGMSCAKDETFEMFVGRNDLGAPIESIFAPGYYQGFQFHKGKVLPQDFQKKDATKYAISGRMTRSTLIKAELYFENEGAVARERYQVNGQKVMLYNLPKSMAWGANLFGKKSVGGMSNPAEELCRVYAWRHYSALGWFEWRPIYRVTPIPGAVNQEFHLIGFFMDDTLADYNIPQNLYIPRGTGQDGWD